MLNMGEIAKVYKEIRNAIRLYPDYVDLHFYKALSLLQTTGLKRLRRAFRTACCLVKGTKITSYPAGMAPALLCIFWESAILNGREKHFEDFQSSVPCLPRPKGLGSGGKKIPHKTSAINKSLFDKGFLFSLSLSLQSTQ